MNNTNKKTPALDELSLVLSHLQGSELPFIKTLIDLIPHPLFILSSDGKLKAYNNIFEKNICGKTIDTHIGKTFSDIQPLFFAKKCDLFFNRALQTHESALFETLLQYTDYQVHQVSISIAPLYYNNFEGDIIGLVNDITLINDYDLAVRTSEQKYRRLFEESNDAIIIHDDQGLILDVNKLSIDLFGYTKSEFLSLNFQDLYPDIPEGSFAPNLLSSAYREQKSLRKRNSDLIYCDISSRPFDPSGKLIQAIIRDISYLKSTGVALAQALQEVKKGAIEVEKSNKLKEKFLSIICFEFGTPMNGIMSMIELLKETTLSSAQNDYLEILSQSSKIMMHLINNTVDFSKLVNGTISLYPAQTDLTDLIELSIHELSSKAAEKKLTPSFTINPDLPPFIFADSKRLVQIIDTLISNAVKFTDSGSVHLSISQLHSNSFETTLQFKISDTGIGIEETTKKHLFQAFSHIDTSSTTRFGGTGLGLFVAKQLAGLMNGTIEYESNAGQGSVFWFTVTFPICLHAPGKQLINKPHYSVAIIDPGNTLYPTLCQYLAYDNPQSSLTMFNSFNNLSSISNFDLIVINDETIDPALLEDLHVKSQNTPIIKVTSKAEKHSTPIVSVVLNRPLTRQTVMEKVSTTYNQMYSTNKNLTFSSVDPYYLHILVVDDNLINQKVATKMLHFFGCTVEVANSGVDAIALLSYKKFDLIFLDLQMPFLDGYGVINEIRNPCSSVLDHQVPVIAMTALSSQEDRKKCLDSGMNAFIVKPLTSLELKTVIDSSFRNLSLLNISENDGAAL